MYKVKCFVISLFIYIQIHFILAYCCVVEESLYARVLSEERVLLVILLMALGAYGLVMH